MTENQWNARLCFVDPPWAYFTTQDLAEQTGEGWSEVPYQDFAEPPDEPDFGQGTPKWEIVKVAYDCSNLITPAVMLQEAHLPVQLSVEDINNGRAPWLYQRPFGDFGIQIRAGCSLSIFVAEYMHSISRTAYVALAQEEILALRERMK